MAPLTIDACLHGECSNTSSFDNAEVAGRGVGTLARLADVGRARKPIVWTRIAICMNVVATTTRRRTAIERAGIAVVTAEPRADALAYDALICRGTSVAVIARTGRWDPETRITA